MREKELEENMKKAAPDQGDPKTLQVGEYRFDLVPLRGQATQAELIGILARYNWRTNVQEYFVFVSESRDNRGVRLSACRVATRGAVTDKAIYVSSLSLFPVSIYQNLILTFSTFTLVASANMCASVI